jgi:uncharacterized OsmC-like protein
VRVTYAENLGLRFIKNDLRAENRRGPGGGFETITQEIYAEGTMPADQMEHLCERAQNVCFTHNTLKHGVKMITVIHLNGEEVLRKVSNPGD